MTVMINLNRFLIVLAAVPAMAFAQYTGPHVSPQITTVVAAKNANDDAPVAIEGRIVRKEPGKYYAFSDMSGDVIRVKIKNRKLPAEQFDETTKVRIFGEVDKEFFQDTTIEVKRMEVVR